MNKVLVFGHKSPDTDTVTSAVVMANLENKLGIDAKACVLGKLNKETKYVFDYLKIDEPEFIQKVDEGQAVILVDHNEFAQSVDGIENAKIKKVVDHHRICGLKTAEPLYYRAEPVGCTATVLYKMYKENNVEIEKNIAILERKGIEFKNMQLKNGQFVDLGQREKRKKRIRQQTELEKQVQMIIRKPKKVKPGYKKKRKYQVEQVVRKQKRAMIRDDIRRQKKERARQAQIAKRMEDGNDNW